MRGKVFATDLPMKDGKVDVQKIHDDGKIIGGIEDKYGKQYGFFPFDWHSGFRPWPWQGAEVEFSVVDKYARRVFSMDPLTEIIQRYPGPVTLRSPWKKNILPAIALPFLGVLGVVLLFTHNLLWILLGVLFVLGGFGASFLYAMSLIPGGSTLVLDRDGFEVTFLFRKRAYAWEAAMLPDHPAHNRKTDFQRRLRDPHYYGVDSLHLPLLMQQWCKLSLGLIKSGISYWPETMSDKEFLEALEEPDAATGS